MSIYLDSADARILKAAYTQKHTKDLITGEEDGSIPITYYRVKEGWDLDNKYTIAKKEAVDSFDWFVHEWNKVGWGIDEQDYDILKKLWMLSGAPFLSHVDPDGREATSFYYYPTSRTIDLNTRTTFENISYYIGSPDIVVMPHPQRESMLSEEESLGPFVLLDELSHAIQFAYPTGIKGKNITGADDMATFIASDEFIQLLKHKQIGYDRNGNQRLVSRKGYGKAVGFDESLTDSLLFIHAQQLKGDPFLDKGLIVNMFDNEKYYNERGHFDLRYALASEASGQWLTGEAQAHQLFAPALHLAYADLKTSGGEGDGELSVSDIHELNKTAMGKKVVGDMIYRYGVGQDDIYYGTLSDPSITKTTYKASSTDPKLVQYNERITTDDDRYRIAKYNQDEYMKRSAKKYKNTLKNLSDFRKQRMHLHPNARLEQFIKEQNERDK
jgi:hypothetical protein